MNYTASTVILHVSSILDAASLYRSLHAPNIEDFCFFMKGQGHEKVIFEGQYIECQGRHKVMSQETL